ncbi:thermonuclease family protein [Paracoccus sp. (in: a-proteobacteria)]|uniref:thermonuclease family protein n=1 Tax=Paracoccus sp. TaxID=267 RepID=UPI00321FF355
MMTLRLCRILPVLAVFVALTALVPSSGVEAAQPAALEGKVSKVLDGDTFTLSGESRRIRVWGLDAPERSDSGGSAATAAMRGLITGKTLRCQVRDLDRYGRYVGQCFLPDGRDIAAEMIGMGVATEYCRFSRNHYGTC